MVVFRIGESQMASLDDGAVAAVIEAAGLAAGPSDFPILCSLFETDSVVDPMALMDELARLAATEHGEHVALLIGSLRDDLMEELAAAEEG
jgi:hypothetical protein